MDSHIGGAKNKKSRNIIIDNNFVTIKKATDTKEIFYTAHFNKLIGNDAINDYLLNFQTVIETILSSIDNRLSFSSFYSLEEYLEKNELCSYNTVVKFVNSIDLQIDMLRSKKKSILSLSVKDVWIINDKFFIFMGNNRLDNYGLVDFNYKQNIIIHKTLKLGLKSDNFIAPELLLKTSNGGGNGDDDDGDDNDSEGEIYHRNVSNFSLGKIIIVMLFGKVVEKQMDFKKNQLLMKPIINTKIYFYVLRCIDPDPAMRANLYV
jgi:hypothetical protein